MKTKKAGTENRQTSPKPELPSGQPSTSTEFSFAGALQKELQTIMDICFKIAGQDGEGAVSETVLALYAMQAQIKNPTQMAIAVRKVADRQAKLKYAERYRATNAISLDDMRIELDERQLPFVHASYGEEITVGEALSELPELYAEVFVSHAIEGNGIAQIALELGITEAEVKSHYRSSLKAIKKILSLDGKANKKIAPQLAATKPAHRQTIAA